MNTRNFSLDLREACTLNGIDITDVLRIVLEITGRRDSANWHWIVKTTKGYAYITAGCSYTGWDFGNRVERFDGTTIAHVLRWCPIEVSRVFKEMRTKKETTRLNTEGL